MKDIQLLYVNCWNLVILNLDETRIDDILGSAGHIWIFLVYLSPVSPPTIWKCHSKLIVIKLVSLDQGPCFSVKILEVVSHKLSYKVPYSKVFYLISKLCQVLKIQKKIPNAAFCDFDYCVKESLKKSCL